MGFRGTNRRMGVGAEDGEFLSWLNIRIWGFSDGFWVTKGRMGLGGGGGGGEQSRLGSHMGCKEGRMRMLCNEMGCKESILGCS